MFILTKMMPCLLLPILQEDTQKLWISLRKVWKNQATSSQLSAKGLRGLGGFRLRLDQADARSATLHMLLFKMFRTYHHI